MNLWELQLWEREAVDVADEGETICFTVTEAWAEKIAERLQDSVGSTQVIRKRLTSFEPRISQDVSGSCFHVPFSLTETARGQLQ